MGYYTDFTLTAGVYDGDENVLRPIPMSTLETLGCEIDKLNVFDCDPDISVDDLDYGLYGNAKWYKCNHDMCLLSKRYPGILFHLYGEGEEKDDMWDAYYLDGKMEFHKCIIVRGEFSQKLLEPYREDLDAENDKYSCQ